MDRALKERIVGAVVLVAVGVLVVPVFLDGSAERAEVVTESVTLPGQDGESRKRQTIVLERDRTEPVPAAEQNAPESSTEPAPEAAETTPEPAAVAAADDSPAENAPVRPGDSEPAAEETNVEAGSAAVSPGSEAPAASEAGSGTGMWAVQLGSFAQTDNAERLAADLRKEGYAAFLSRLKGPNGPLHRVRIGPQKDRASAEATAEKLAAAGHQGQVVPHP